MKLKLALCVLVLALLQYQLWFSDDGVVDVLSLRQKIVAQKEDNQQLAAYNEHLAQQIKVWKHSRQPIESRARHELGMIREGEVFYRFLK